MKKVRNLSLVVCAVAISMLSFSNAHAQYNTTTDQEYNTTTTTDQEYNTRDNDVQYARAGFVLGSSIGLAAGLLAAPSTGKQTRKKLSKKSKKLAKQLAGYVGMEDKFQGSTTGMRKNGRTPVEEQG